MDDGQAWADEMVFRTSYLLPALRPGGGGTAGADGIASAEEERIVAEEGAASEAWGLEVSRPLREAFGSLSEAYERLRAVEDALPAGLVTMEVRLADPCGRVSGGVIAAGSDASWSLRSRGTLFLCVLFHRPHVSW